MQINSLKKWKNLISAIMKRNPIYIYLNGTTMDKKKVKILGVIFLPLAFLHIGYIAVKNISANLFYRKYKYGISVVSIIKDEAPYLDEWLEYHKAIGVEHFYLYDNDSKDNTSEVLKKYIDEGCVTYKSIKGSLRQYDAYNNALGKYAGKTRIMIFIDADEFIFLQEGCKLYEIAEVVLGNNKVGGIAVNWCLFGSGHFFYKPEGLVTQNYLYRSKNNCIDNFQIKTICNPRKVLGFQSAHYAVYMPFYYAVNTDGEKVYGAKSSKVCHNKIRINHYFTKSKEEFLKKRARGMADQPGIRDINNFDKYDRNEVFDNSMLRYKELEKILIRTNIG